MRKEQAKGNIGVNKPLSAYLNLLSQIQTRIHQILFMIQERMEHLKNSKSQSINQYFPEDVKQRTVKKALEVKGFQIKIVQKEVDFIKYAANYDQLWIISSYYPQCEIQISNTLSIQEFVKVVMDHLKQKKGLFLWGDHSPYYYHANQILKELDFNGVKIQLAGNNPGARMLSRRKKDGPKIKSFISHQITTGIFHMNEGPLMGYPIDMLTKKKQQSQDLGDVVVIGQSSDRVPAYMAIQGNEERGRIIIDCCYKKLVRDWWSGNSRYVKNCAVWLLWLENLIK